MLKRWLGAGILICLAHTGAAAATLLFTVSTSEPVIVSGMPRIAIDVGGVTRHAAYQSGSGTSALVFSYPVQAGDFDANGITLASPLDLNGGSIADVAGNPASSLAFTLPDTSALSVQTYTAAFTTSPITSANAHAVNFAIAKAPLNASFSYTISSDGGAGSVTGSGTITASPHPVAAVDVSKLPAGSLTLSVTVSTPAGGTGAAKTVTATPVSTGILDGRAVPEMAISLYRLRGDYAGPLIRVRRSSDNAEQNIGVGTVGGSLDTTALSAFCGASSCFIRTWYDQSGNGRDAQNATASWQPRIVNAGTIERFNGLPAPFFNGTANALVSSPVLPSVTSVWSTHLSNVVGYGQTGRGRVWALDANPSLAVSAVTGGDDYFGSSGSIGSMVTVNPRIVSLAVTTAGACTFWVNGSQSATVSSGVSFSGGQALVVGNTGVLNRAYNGYVQSLILGTGSYPSADRLAIERWLGAISGITVP